MTTLHFSRCSYPERLTGAIRVKCLAQWRVDRFFKRSSRIGYLAVPVEHPNTFTRVDFQTYFVVKHRTATVGPQFINTKRNAASHITVNNIQAPSRPTLGVSLRPFFPGTHIAEGQDVNNRAHWIFTGYSLVEIVTVTMPFIFLPSGVVDLT